MTFTASVNGLLVNNDYLDIISNNIANASTIGYKTSTPIFYDIFSRRAYSLNNTGSGVGVLNVVQNFNNGTLVTTGRDLDLAIVQNGFFRVTDAQGKIYYTRNGQFVLDENKNIVNMQGMYLTGHNISNEHNTKDNLNNKFNLEAINLQHAYKLEGKPTTKIKLDIKLNENDKFVKHTNLSTDPSYPPYANYTTNIDIYNKNNKRKTISVDFYREDEHIWMVHVVSNEKFKDSQENNKKDIDTLFPMQFDEKGKLISDSIIKIKPNNPDYENIDFDVSNSAEIKNIHNSIEESVQNGYSSGSLKTFDILPNGTIMGTYSNEQKKPIVQILLSKFINPEKLQHESGSMWSATANSGKETIGIAGDQGFGVLATKTLEYSNVDLNKELINMIIAQRNYQSNAQSFKAEDKIISTLINLK
ncbi:flagellar hook protein FlgE [Buchnera aphidicola (Hyadaphis tataricae)]|uniref:Flagellar hook protein FlgE n=1 Tax=Buchnera aphidicola (Hyadaphis tataricae) TaxID=1241859 RepID=A0A4D6XZC8_9GAMM|nr:flagellar hook protein FlgE [Buchnera aphidicola]QCI21637.1 flagellar hook protein FlgE [Buchnera aphidicola (Hyadaphis tataricae)]